LVLAKDKVTQSFAATTAFITNASETRNGNWFSLLIRPYSLWSD